MLFPAISLITGIAASPLLCRCFSFEIQVMVFCRPSSSRLFLVQCGLGEETVASASHYVQMIYKRERQTTVFYEVPNVKVLTQILQEVERDHQRRACRRRRGFEQVLKDEPHLGSRREDFLVGQ